MDQVDELRERAAAIKLIALDCDGVLTDGRIYIGDHGEAFKAFDVKDGQGIADWHRSGGTVAIITGRESEMVNRRAHELGIEIVVQGSKDKGNDLLEIINGLQLDRRQVAYMGDDTPDLSAFEIASVTFAPADAVGSVKRQADVTVSHNGGRGAVREMIDFLLSAAS